MIQLRKKINMFSIILTGIIVTLTLHPPNDPDMWWHLRVGKMLWQGIFPSTDLFSHTMPGYAWVNHEWFTDGIMYVLTLGGGLLLLNSFFIAIFLLAFYLAIRLGRLRTVESNPAWEKVKKTKYFEAFLLIIGLLAAYPILGTRPQMITLLGFSLCYLILWLFISNKKDYSIWLPLIFLIWVNTHGGYLVGLGLYFLFLVASILQKILPTKISPTSPQPLPNKKILKLTSLFLLSIAACLLNPYGLRIFTESFSTTLDSYAHQTIAEWLPVDIWTITGLLVLLYAALVGSTLLITKVKLTIYDYLLLPTFFLLGITSWRHSPLFILITLPLLYAQLTSFPRLTNFFTRDYKKLFDFDRRKKSRFFFNILLILGVVFFMFARMFDVTLSSISASYFSARHNYPNAALNHLRNNPGDQNLFSLYSWGGYLIWFLPEEKIFIDGRMASWRNSEHHILKEYYDILQKTNESNERLSSFQVDQILYPVGDDDDFLRYMEKSSLWQEVYRDDIAVIFQRT